MSIQVNRITNANVYLDGRSMIGRVEEATLPTVKYKMSEHKALGMNGSFELPAGIDKLECSIKWNSFYQDALAVIGDPNKAIAIQLRGSIKNWTANGVASEVPLVVHLTCQAKDFPLGGFKQHDNVELTSAMACTYCKIVVNGVEIMEVDVLSNIHKVNGVDALAAYRANLGI